MTDKFYFSRAWRDFRKAYIQTHPVCSVTGCGKPTYALDHVIRRSLAPERSLDPTNIAPLCQEHHNRKSRVHDQTGKTGVYQHEMQGCDATGQPLDPKHHWR